MPILHGSATLGYTSRRFERSIHMSTSFSRLIVLNGYGATSRLVRVASASPDPQLAAI